jgi:hypothetical protein
MHNHEYNKKQFFDRGWCRFKADDDIRRWVDACLPLARSTLIDDKHARWLRCGGTWFAGVNVLPNKPDSSLPGGPMLGGEVIEFIDRVLQQHDFDWDMAQLSVCYPGYPQPMASESEAAFRFRRDRDAAHVDGFLREGPRKRRHLREHHGFILGIPLLEYDEHASPLVVWEGSHELVRAAMKHRYRGINPDNWGDEDITEAYHVVRRQIFEQCHRRKIVAAPGEAYLLHRLMLHGISPWSEGAAAAEEGRMICYFRPEIGNAEDWLNKP